MKLVFADTSTGGLSNFKHAACQTVSDQIQPVRTLALVRFSNHWMTVIMMAFICCCVGYRTAMVLIQDKHIF